MKIRNLWAKSFITLAQGGVSSGTKYDMQISYRTYQFGLIHSWETRP